MDTIITVVGGIAKAVAIFGGTLAAVFVAYAGILWMIAAGDPQRMAQARSALIGSVVGLIIVGVSFLIPPTVSELVIEPAGGVAIESVNSFDCDGMLKAQLVSRRWANDPPKMQRIITEIQAKQDECSSERWTPVVKAGPGRYDACFGGTTGDKMAMSGVLVPRALKHGGLHANHPEITNRDAANNIFVYWQVASSGPPPVPEGRPSDGALCWMYVSAFGSWREHY